MHSNLEIVRRSYAASNRGDPRGILADVAPDGQWTEMAGFPCAGTYSGADAILRNVFERLGQEWEGYSATAEAFHDAGDTIVVTGWYAGTYRKSGKSFRARFAHVWRLRDGKIHRFEQFTDTLLVARAMAGDGPGGR